MTFRGRSRVLPVAWAWALLIVLTIPSISFAGGTDSDGDGGGADRTPAALLQQCHLNPGTPFGGTVPGDVQISNLKPGIVNSSMNSTPGGGGTVTIEVVVQDPNSWLDVYTVVIVMYFRATPQACAAFRMGRNASDVNQPEPFFEDLLDTQGIFEVGSTKRFRTGNPAIDDTHLQVTFVFRKVAANFMTIHTLDRRFEGTSLQFEMDPTLRPQLLNNAVIPWAASLVSAGVAAAMLMMMRFRSNQLAQLAERRTGRARAVIASKVR